MLKTVLMQLASYKYALKELNLQISTQGLVLFSSDEEIAAGPPTATVK